MLLRLLCVYLLLVCYRRFFCSYLDFGLVCWCCSFGLWVVADWFAVVVRECQVAAFGGVAGVYLLWFSLVFVWLH